MEVRYYPLLQNRRIEHVVAIARDVTDRKQAEAFREEYVSFISHDLRNPLTALLGQSDWLRRVLSAKGLEREARAAESMLTSARRLNSMVQDLADSVRLEAGVMKMQIQPVDLFHLVTDISERVGTLEDRARIHLEVPDWVPPVRADRDYVERAIVNLLTNALKYSAPDTPVILRVVRGDGAAVVSVIDQGVGIPPEEMPFLFEKFYRARTGKKAEGLGLGLYITRMIVEALGGRIWAESKLRKGSTFSFTLPLA
jgi:signal transduction histidine kinase